MTQNVSKKLNGQAELNTHIIFESALMLLTKNYQKKSVLLETTACQSRRVF